MSFETLKVKTLNNASKIEKFLVNVKKTGEAKRDEHFLKARSQLLEHYWECFQNIQDELLMHATAEELKSDEFFKKDVYSDVECAYVAAKQVLETELSKFKPALSIAPAEDQNSSSSSFKSLSSPMLNLPKISLPNFSGSLLEWPSYRDTFVSMIHENTGLTEIEKMHYLKTSVTGDAAQLIKHFSISKINYVAAWNAITGRYENKRILVNANIQAIVSLSNMTSESGTELRRVLDSFNQAVRCLENLVRPVSKWDDWLVFFLANKLDSTTRKDWETSLNASTTPPTFEILAKFLESRLQALNAIKNAHVSRFPQTSTLQKSRFEPRHSRAITKAHFSSSQKTCLSCKGNHILIFCPDFRGKSVEQRLAFLKEKKVCLNCMKPDHLASSCASPNRCKQCGSKHHTMAHQQSSANNNVSPTASTSRSFTESQPLTSGSTSSHFSNQNSHENSSVLLATAAIIVKSSSGQTIRARALIDQGSESCFITSSLANLLHLKKRNINISVSGVGQCNVGTSSAIVIHEIMSVHDPSIKYEVQSLVLPTLTKLLPSNTVSKQNLPHIAGLLLADPHFDKPANIDLFLGVKIYAQILRRGLIRTSANSLVAQKTTLGWILFGEARHSSIQQSTVSCHASLDELNNYLRKFWESEEPPATSRLTPTESECEEFYNQTTKRVNGGRFEVKLPFQLNPNLLGESRSNALSSFLHLEKQLVKDKQSYEQYSQFLSEYLKLNHMQLVEDEQVNLSRSYYLPHHAVFKKSLETAHSDQRGKIRVVFNASRKTTSGYSLNDLLHVGQRLQRDLPAVVMLWRMYPHVLVADIEKMFRQILVNNRDTDFQRILWRFNPDDMIRCYKLLTVTYGTACAPYLSCRTLAKLANDSKNTHPLAANIILQHLYVDDFLFGAFSQSEALNIRDELISLLQTAGFKLRKWMSNSTDLLFDIPEEDLEMENSFKFVSDPEIKTLGLTWNPIRDDLSFRIALPSYERPTKRLILSDISRIYDPLGWLAPVIIVAKLFIQRLWLLKLDWDIEIEPRLALKWIQFKTSLNDLHTLKIPRWLGVTGNQLGLELHGFSDSSLSAYGAAVYVRIIHDMDNIEVSLIAAKTRVSPVKTVSLPRLELCGAALLAQLVYYVQDEFKWHNVPVHLWCDSTVVLDWLQEHPSKWKVFVANRVALIHDKQPNALWHHVPSADNPADCSTRGLSLEELRHHTLWWTGPSWLQLHSSRWPKQATQEEKDIVDAEIQNTLCLHLQSHDPNLPLLTSCSNFTSLIRIFAYALRFIKNAKTKCPTLRLKNFLTLTELETSQKTLIKLIQHSHFSTEIAHLVNKKPLPHSSKIKSLFPTLDNQHILRVGGRLENALLSYDEKHPILLPKQSAFSTLIIRHTHETLLHAGTQATLHALRSKYWIVHGRTKVRQLIRSCVTCCRQRGQTKFQLMGQLPRDRVIPAKPFLHCGVDYAGPFLLRPIKGRGRTIIKAYIAIFVCLATRATHVELVMDLTKDSFIAAFRRFISRRGRCARIYSDNATNFKGACNELKRHLSILESNTHFRSTILNHGTEWHFIPPASPHFGGLWEAGVKSLKYHFKRIAGNSILSIEEMLTLIAQIEACLNSRPLYANSDDSEDLSALTAGHFLVGESLHTFPCPSTIDSSTNILTRWQLVQTLYRHLWERWYKEYISTLQLRNKWQNPQNSIKINDLVLVKEENLPPSKWLMGRVVELHPGADGYVRVVSLKTKDGHLKRAVAKLCVLPYHPPAEVIHSYYNCRHSN